MAPITLPLSFNNSFWTQDYRRGLEVLFSKLEQGVAENEEIVSFIRARAYSEAQLASALQKPAPSGITDGFDLDDGASLLMAFRGLQAETAAQGQAHRAISTELQTLVADPFEGWAKGYKDRLSKIRATALDEWLRAYETSYGEALKLKQQYLAKTRKADEAADDARFAPVSNPASEAGDGDKYTTSPRLQPVDGGRVPPKRSASVSERISQRLKEIQQRSVSALASATEPVKTEPEAATASSEPKVDVKGKGKEVVEEPQVLASPPPMAEPLPPSKVADTPKAVSPTLVVPHQQPHQPSIYLVAGLSMTGITLSHLLIKASKELKMQPVRVPVLGEYPDCFNGEEFVSWLNANVDGFGGSYERAADAAQDLTETHKLLRRVGELGNLFEGNDDAFYQFRPKAFELDGKHKGEGAPPSPVVKRTNNFVNLVSKALQANNNGEPPHVRFRREADDADTNYRVAIRRLDRQRLGVEERIEDTLKTLQRWEIERLRAIKTALLQYQGTISNLPKSLEPSIERSGTIISAYQPENDLTALMERYRTGPFRPEAQVYESIAHDEADVVFGIDLRREGAWRMDSQEGKDGVLPQVITALLHALDDAYTRLPNDIEKRKSWVYEVPLGAVHHLREVINGLNPEEPISPEVFAKYDAPVIASTVKLWLLELDPPLALFEGWEELRKLYPTFGGEKEKDNLEQRIADVSAVLQRLPRVCLWVLDAVAKHLRTLIDSTNVEENEEVYIAKVSLSLGRTILRPKIENNISVQDRHPTLFMIDLITHYDKILPPTITRKKRESERKVPIRKRTQMVDARLSRSNMLPTANKQQLLAQEHAAKSGKRDELPPVPPVPPMPPVAEKKLVEEPTQSITEEPETAEPEGETEGSEEESSEEGSDDDEEESDEDEEGEPVITAEPEEAEGGAGAPLAPTQPSSMPPMPAFKEPPPELDDLPPRPQFKEPPPESADDGSPRRPQFKEPESDSDEESGSDEEEEEAAPAPPPAKPSPPPPVTVPSPSTASPVDEFGTKSPGGANIHRQSSAGVRGPRIARGPRAPGGGSVSNMVQNLNRASSPSMNSPSSPSYKRMSGAGASARGGLTRTPGGSLSRRTMASDAEDNLVEK